MTTATAQPLKLTREEREAWEPHLELMFPRKAMLRPGEVAEILGVDTKTVDRLFGTVPSRPETLRLLGIELNAGAGERQHRRILRDAAVLFYLARANYTPADFHRLMRGVLAQRSARELAVIQQMVGEELKRKL